MMPLNVKEIKKQVLEKLPLEIGEKTRRSIIMENSLPKSALAYRQKRNIVIRRTMFLSNTIRSYVSVPFGVKFVPQFRFFRQI